MTRKQRFGLAAGVAAALTALAGCGGDKCEEVTCPDGQECNSETGECGVAGKCAGQPACQAGAVCDPATGACLKEQLAKCGNPAVACPAGQFCNTVDNKCAANKCANVTCNPGTGCDPTTGKCKNLCTVAPTCPAPQAGQPTLACDAASGRCVDKCSTVTCTVDTQACNPATGKCVDRCTLVTCTGNAVCNNKTGQCEQLCESATKPVGKPECGDTEKCDPKTGTCVSKCEGVTCDYAAWCDPDTYTPTRACESGKPAAGRPGAACESAADCHVADAADGQTFDCLKQLSGSSQSVEMPGGYCVADCTTAACPDGSVCLQIGCADQCTKDADCRGNPYFCQPLGEGEYGCLPGNQCGKTDEADCGHIGADCVDGTDCADGLDCYPETYSQPPNPPEYTGFLGGYCLKWMRKTDTCPDNGVALRVSATDPNLMICLKSCTPFVVGSCGQGELCSPMDQTYTTGYCDGAQCAGDAECAKSYCALRSDGTTDVSNCGKGQTCTDIGSDGYGECSTVDKCDAQNPCAFGTCTNGLCPPAYCDGALGMCLSPLNCIQNGQDICAAELDGTHCDQASGKCVRSCNDDTNCGPGGICQTVGGSKICQGRCTQFNEADLCAADQVCDTVSGRCTAKCSGDSCGSDAICLENGRCLKKCTLLVGGTQCKATEFCDPGTGKCQEKCRWDTEATVCQNNTVCQTSTGMCLARCTTNPSICGTEACATTGRCGQECTAQNETTVCGVDPARSLLTCQSTGTGSPKRCKTVACSATVACPNTTAQWCDEAAGLCRVKCNNASDCPASAPVCDNNNRCVAAT